LNHYTTTISLKQVNQGEQSKGKSILIIEQASELSFDDGRFYRRGQIQHSGLSG